LDRKQGSDQMYLLWSQVLASKGDIVGCFSKLLKELMYQEKGKDLSCPCPISWANENDLKKYKCIGKCAKLFSILINKEVPRNVEKLNQFDALMNAEIKFRKAYQNGEYKKALNLFNYSIKPKIGFSGGHQRLVAISFLEIGLTNSAIKIAWEGYQSRNRFSGQDDAQFPPKEIQIISNAMGKGTPLFRVKQYERWLQTKINEYNNQGRFSDAKSAKNEYIKIKKLIKRIQNEENN